MAGKFSFLLTANSLPQEVWEWSQFHPQLVTWQFRFILFYPDVTNSFLKIILLPKQPESFYYKKWIWIFKESSKPSEVLAYMIGLFSSIINFMPPHANISIRQMINTHPPIFHMFKVTIKIGKTKQNKTKLESLPVIQNNNYMTFSSYKRPYTICICDTGIAPWQGNL